MRTELQADAALEHRDDHCEARLVDVVRQPPRRSITRFTDECLNFDEHRPRSDDARHNARSAWAALPSREKELRRIRNLMQSVGMHRKDANFVDAAEAIFVGAHDTMVAVEIAF